MARVYLSGSDVQREALQIIAQDLTDLGFEVAFPRPGVIHPALARWFDLMNSDILVTFDTTPMCMIELGAAKALAHRIIAIGLRPKHDDAALFLPDVTHYADYPTARREFFEKPSSLRILRREK